MASLWQRAKGFINNRILQRQEEAYEEPFEPYPAPPPSFPDFPYDAPPPPPQPEVGSSQDYISVYDDFGNFLGSHTYEEWWNITMLKSADFHRFMGDNMYTKTLIHLLEEEMGIVWDWDAWSDEYEARNG